MMEDKKIVLFDGLCAFCNYWVRFAFKYNSNKDLYFLPLEDERAQKLLANHLNIKEINSVIFYRKGDIFTSSTAALKIGTELNLFLKIISNILLIIPKFIGDKVYNFIAKRRYKWFGKYESCPTPPQELRERFL